MCSIPVRDYLFEMISQHLSTNIDSNRHITLWTVNTEPLFFPRQILPNSTAKFVKFREIPQHYNPQIPYIPRPVGILVLTDNTSKYKEFIVTCNTKTHYFRPLMMKILS